MESPDAELKNEWDDIVDQDIRMFTRLMLLHAPKRAFEMPASMSGKHHPPDERIAMGGLRHVKRCYQMCKHMAEMEDLSTRDEDLLLSAALLHDICRLGVDGKSEHTVTEHPILVKDLVLQVVSEDSPYMAIAGEVCDIIAGHMGRWFQTECNEWLASLLHIADYVASRDNVIVEVEDAHK